MAVRHLAPHVRLQRGDVHRLRRHRVHLRRHVLRHLGASRSRIGIAIGAKLFAPRLNRLRSRLHVASPLEYLKNRYNLQHPAGARLVRHAAEDRGRRRQVGGHRHPVVASSPASPSPRASSSPASSPRSTARSAACGPTRSPNWASSSSSCIAGLAMLVAALNKLGGVGGICRASGTSPSSRGHGNAARRPVHARCSCWRTSSSRPSSTTAACGTRPSATWPPAPPSEATRSARLSAALWLVWPVVLFFPMWVSPLLVHAQEAGRFGLVRPDDRTAAAARPAGPGRRRLLLAHDGHVLLRRQRHRRRLHPGHGARRSRRRHGAWDTRERA